MDSTFRYIIRLVRKTISEHSRIIMENKARTVKLQPVIIRHKIIGAYLLVDPRGEVSRRSGMEEPLLRPVASMCARRCAVIRETFDELADFDVVGG